MIKIILFILFSLLCSIIYCFIINKENFNRTTGKWCENCETKSFGQCMDCFNCGFCMTEANSGYCTKGNIFGPEKYNDKCKKWMHNDEFVKNLHQTNTCNN